MSRIEIATPVGDAWVDLDLVKESSLALLMGHGAGGGVDAPDIVAVQKACLAAGITVARVTQPYRVAGKKVPPSSSNIDTAWAAIVAALAKRKALADKGFVFAGRSSGARVACRAASSEQVLPRPIAVVTLAFPEHPPGKPEKSRMDELDAVANVPVLVVQGESDPFGMPPEAPGRTRVVVPGDHSLKKSAGLVGTTVADWLTSLR